jgi:hypothetical protein
MDDFMNVERNPITKILGQESDIDVAGVSMNDAVGFFFVVSVLRGVKGGNWATRLVRTLIRCYAALAFVMPLMLGGLPSDGMKNMDKSAWLVVYAMIFEMVNVGGVHPRLGDLVDRCCGWSYSIMKANACVAGYAAFKAAFPGSTWAPLLGAFVATNGHNFIEKGMGAFDLTVAGKGNKDNKLAVLGGAVISVLQSQFATSALVTKSTMSFLNIMQDHFDFDKVVGMGSRTLNQVTGTVSGLVGGKKMRSSMKRSSTPKRR